MVAFSEEIWPLPEAFRSRGGPGYNTQVVQVDSGAVEASDSWQAPLMRFERDPGRQWDAAAYQGYEFFLAHHGSLVGFRLKDNTDNTSASDGVSAATDMDQVLGIGDGSNTVFQLVKTYTVGSQSMTRPIVKPIAGTELISVNGSGTSAFSCDATTGLVTMDTAPTAGHIVRGGFGFHVPVQFSPEIDDWLAITAEDYQSNLFDALLMIELRTATAYDLRVKPGGSKNWGDISTNVSTNLAFGNYQRFNPTTGGPLQVRLPRAADQIATGGGFYTFENTNGVNSLEVADYTGTALVGNSIIGPNSFGDINLALDTSGTRIWKLAL